MYRVIYKTADDGVAAVSFLSIALDVIKAVVPREIPYAQLTAAEQKAFDEIIRTGGTSNKNEYVLHGNMHPSGLPAQIKRYTSKEAAHKDLRTILTSKDGEIVDLTGSFFPRKEKKDGA